ncbi:MAG: hypothetical protein MJY99_05720 [Fibrobacter sp.]|nr:hypothetical protein [Fibrobacter sp.]
MTFSTDQIIPQLSFKLQELKNTLYDISKQNDTSPEGNLRIANQGTYAQYYHITQKNNEIFIPSNQSEFVHKLAQKSYNQKLEKILKRQIQHISKFIEKYNPSELVNAYNNLHTERQKLVKPFFVSDEEYAAQWSAVPYAGKPFSDDAPEHYASNGLRVRSKSEAIIADVLLKLQIPFRYEAAVKIKVKKGGLSQAITFHPDFTCLNARTRQEFIWEHFGLMSDEEYLENAIEKERIYATAGYIPGINFISTMESKAVPLNRKHVEQIVKNLLK